PPPGPAPASPDLTGLLGRALAAGAPRAASTLTAIDFGIRDCRLIAGLGQAGAAIRMGFAARVEDTWIIGGNAARLLGFLDGTVTGAITGPGSIGLALVGGELITAVDNRILGFDQGIVASGGSTTLGENLVIAGGGPAISVDTASGSVVLRGNSATTAGAASDQTP